MTIAFWCVLITALMPYVWTTLAKSSKKRYDNNNPRNFLNSLEGWGQRANWAQSNSFEAFPFFAAAVIIGHVVGNIDPATLNYLAIAFVIFRIVYGICYLTDKATLRSLVWMMSIACNVAIFVLSA